MKKEKKKRRVNDGYHFKVHKEEEGYWAECVELDGCFTQADNMVELRENMLEALKSYFTHKKLIQFGKEGEFSKITEEYQELEDAYSQGKRYFSVVESADLITVVGHFTWKQFKIPLILVVIFAYIRKPYKWVRNFFLRIYLRHKEVNAMMEGDFDFYGEQ